LELPGMYQLCIVESLTDCVRLTGFFSRL
jgi:hypothetical protein